MGPKRKSRDSLLWKNLRKVYLYEEEDRASAVQAVERVAREAISTALQEQQARSSVLLASDVVVAAATANHPKPKQTDMEPRQQPRSGSVEFYDDQSSYLSLERGIFRGSKRGLFEENEVRFTQDVAGDYFSLDGSTAINNRDLTTAAETSTFSGGKLKKDNPKKEKQERKSFSFNRDSLKKLGLGRNFTQISNEAWMCGICAKSFSSFDAAENHEDYHIREVIMDIGWVCNPAGNIFRNVLEPFSAPRGGPVLEVQSERNINSDAIIAPSTPQTSSLPRNFGTGVSTPRPDFLAMSKKNLSLSMSRLDPKAPVERNRHFEIARENAFPGRVSFQPINDLRESTEYDLLVPHGMRNYLVLADEALVDVTTKAEKLVLTQLEKEAEFELACCSKDKQYYDMLEKREIERRQDGAYGRFRTEGKNIAQKVQNKFIDAYALCKEGKSKKAISSVDHYKRKLKGDTDVQNVINNTKDTLYVNVIVKNSLQVVSHELERLAKQRWEEYKAKTSTENGGLKDLRNEESRAQFERFKAAAQGNLVKLAGFALASDFTPRRIAVQLSNDLYRLLTPRLKRRGIFIETEIEYRVGAYFVLAVNVLRVDWRRLVKMTHGDVTERRAKWIKESEAEDAKEGVKRFYGPLSSLIRLSRMTNIEILGQFISTLYYFHWTIYTPICLFLYHFVMGEMFRKYFLSSVTDGELCCAWLLFIAFMDCHLTMHILFPSEIFYYVERKGMEMNIQIKDAQDQTAFMLSALQEIRADGRELKKKQEKSGEEEEGELLGPLLGPVIKEDGGPAPPIPDGFEVPENLDFVGLELNLQVGFRRLRWALLSSESTFISEGVWKAESNYDKYVASTSSPRSCLARTRSSLTHRFPFLF
jgi:hypothetical protein